MGVGLGGGRMVGGLGGGRWDEEIRFDFWSKLDRGTFHRLWI